MEQPARAFAIDEKQYPFIDHWYTHRGVYLHYIDEGNGFPVVMLHGNPTWSFLYRTVVQSLSGQVRAVVPDYPGFGFSGLPRGFGYTPSEYRDAVAACIDATGVSRVILVMHDWGGPIGLSYALSHPDRIAGMVLCNTWCWPPRYDARIFSLLMGGPIGKFLCMRYNFFARAILPGGMSRRNARTPALVRNYAVQFKTPARRKATYTFARHIRKSAGWLAHIRQHLGVLSQVPVEMVWGRRDPIFGKRWYVRQWKKVFPYAHADTIVRASHYVPEDAPGRVTGAIQRLLERL